MRVWTIQHNQVYKTLLKKGQYKADGRFICSEHFRSAYNWLISEAQKKVPSWTDPGAVWFWDKKPDLRTYRWIYHSKEPREQDFVLLELEVDPKLCLRSDFDSWHLVLNDRFCDTTKKGSSYDDFYNRLPKKYHSVESSQYPRSYQKELHGSWSQVLREKPKKNETHQVIKEKIFLSEVKSVTHFKMINKAKK